MPATGLPLSSSTLPKISPEVASCARTCCGVSSATLAVVSSAIGALAASRVEMASASLLRWRAGLVPRPALTRTVDREVIGYPQKEYDESRPGHPCGQGHGFGRDHRTITLNEK